MPARSVLCRREGPHGEARPQSRPHEDPARLSWSWSATPSKRRRPSAPSSTAWCITPSAIASLSIALGADASKFDPDGPLPDDIPESNASKSGRERAIALAKRENLTVRQLAQRLGGHSGGLPWSARPKTIADQMEEWLDDRGSRRLHHPVPVPARRVSTTSSTSVVPELQRRGLFRTEYEGRTLRENLGLPRPANRFFS